MAWTSVPKPTSTTYTTVNPTGKESYDQPEVVYDSTTVFYDGVNQLQWSSVNKPVSSTWTFVAKPT